MNKINSVFDSQCSIRLILVFTFSLLISNQVSAQMADDHQGCFHDYTIWDSSYNYDPDGKDWNFKFMTNNTQSNIPSVGYVDLQPVNFLQQFLDLNGDGLPDYIYSLHGKNQGPQGGAGEYVIRDCIALNTGSGFDIAYKCVYDLDANGTTRKYHGDCAGD